MTEAGGIDGVGGCERLGPLGADVLSRGVVDRSGCVVADARMAVVVVVVVEEGPAEGPGVLQRAEALGEARAVLEGPELCLAVGVVVALTG